MSTGSGQSVPVERARFVRTIGGKKVHFVDTGALARAMGRRDQDGGWLWGVEGGRWVRATEALPTGFTHADAEELMRAVRANRLQPTPLRGPDAPNLGGTASGSGTPGGVVSGSGGPTGGGTGSGRGQDPGDATLAGAGLLGQGGGSGSGSGSSSNTSGQVQPTDQTTPGGSAPPQGARPWDPGAAGQVPDVIREVPYWPTLMFPTDPVYEAFRQAGGTRSLDQVRADLERRYPIGSQLAPGDPWHHRLTIGGQEVDFYDAAGRFGSDRPWLWWKEGVGWVSLLDEQPAGFDSRVLEAYRSSRQRPLDPIVGRDTRGVNGQAVTQNVFGGGFVDGDGTRVLRGGYDRYADGTVVFYAAMVWSPQEGRWYYQDLRGRMPDGREWRADWGWYSPESGSSRPRFTTGGKPGVQWITGGSAANPGPAPRPSGGAAAAGQAGADPGGKAD